MLGAPSNSALLSLLRGCRTLALAPRPLIASCAISYNPTHRMFWARLHSLVYPGCLRTCHGQTDSSSLDNIGHLSSDQLLEQGYDVKGFHSDLSFGENETLVRGWLFDIPFWSLHKKRIVHTESRKQWIILRIGNQWSNSAITPSWKQLF